MNKSLLYSDVSKAKWYYSKKPRYIPIDPLISKIVQEIDTARPAYGTKRMAAAVSGDGFIISLAL